MTRCWVRDGHNQRWSSRSPDSFSKQAERVSSRSWRPIDDATHRVHAEKSAYRWRLAVQAVGHEPVSGRASLLAGNLSAKIENVSNATCRFAAIKCPTLLVLLKMRARARFKKAGNFGEGSRERHCEEQGTDI